MYAFRLWNVMSFMIQNQNALAQFSGKIVRKNSNAQLIQYFKLDWLESWYIMYDMHWLFVTFVWTTVAKQIGLLGAFHCGFDGRKCQVVISFFLSVFSSFYFTTSFLRFVYISMFHFGLNMENKSFRMKRKRIHLNFIQFFFVILYFIFFISIFKRT